MDGRRGSPSRPESAVPCKKAPSETRVGLLSHSNYGGYEINLYLIDIDVAAAVEGEEHSLGVPAVRFLFPEVQSPFFAVCVLESTVYMFGGCHPPPVFGGFHRLPATVPHPKVKYSRKFDLSGKVSPNGDLLVKEEELVEIPTMTYSKCVPIAIATPDGTRVLVFSSVFPVVNSYRAFELYNPQEESWEVLPDIPCYCWHFPFNYVSSEPESEPESESTEPVTDADCACRCEITSYGFVDDSHFFVEMNDGNCVLDISSKKWAHSFARLDPGRVGYFIVAKAEAECDYVIGGGLCSTTSLDIDDLKLICI